MEYMFQPGFLGTRAPFFMDFVTLVVALLPLLVGIAITFAKRKSYTLHSNVQIFIFLISVIIVGYFEYGVRLGGGYEAFVKNTHVSHTYLLVVLVIHIIISVVTLGVWASTLIHARKDAKRGGILPGSHSLSHKKAGLRTFAGIVLTSLTGIWVYLLLFVF
ncbi:MAG: membrane protein [Epsilonproteobacteria bacterium (ex Lamellibrachia satsuma)]|nr:MAG: membrane protein [Epsilonproteobacteria bacterium (ex Lamellibrachia satsuma)]